MTAATRVSQFDDGRDRWCWTEVPAAVPAIGHYTLYSETTASFSTRRELATTGGVFIVNLGSPLEITDARGTLHRFAAGEGFIGGMSCATSLSRNTGSMRGLHIHAPMPVLARLAGVKLADLHDRVVALADLDMHDLAHRLADARTDAALWPILDAALARRLADTRAGSPLVRHAIAALAAGMRVQALADRLGLSRRELARRFRAETALTPRTFAGLARFERFATRLRAAPLTPLADLAADCGYADQPHLTREVARYAATTPAALRARLIPGQNGFRHA